MYDGFTDRSCRVFLEMRSEAFLLDHHHTGTEHLLIAIVEVNDDVTSPVLHRFGVSTETLRREVRALVTPGIDFNAERSTVVIGTPGPDDKAAGPEVAAEPVVSDREFTPRLLKCLMSLAPFEARELGDDHVGPEHLLLAVLREGNGNAVQALQNLGVDGPELMRALYERIADIQRRAIGQRQNEAKRRVRPPSKCAARWHNLACALRIESSLRPITPFRSFACSTP